MRTHHYILNGFDHVETTFGGGLDQSLGSKKSHMAQATYEGPTTEFTPCPIPLSARPPQTW